MVKKRMLWSELKEKKLVMNEDNPEKNPVVLAQNYWTAFCYTDGAETYSWVYVQENSPDSVQVSF